MTARAPMAFHIPTLETDRLILRAPCAADAPIEADFYASEASRFVGGPRRADEAWRGLAAMIGHWALRGYGNWALEDKETGVYLGRAGLWNPHGWPGPELGWTLMPGATGRGLATEAARAARRYAYDVLGLTRLISVIHPDNARSQAVAARLGASFDTIFDHPGHGTLHIWRHPDAATLAEAS